MGTAACEVVWAAAERGHRAVRRTVGGGALLVCLVASGCCGVLREGSLPPFAPERYVCARAGMPIEIDGVPDEAAWRAAPWSADFVDIQSRAMPAPRFRTRVKMLWDDDSFYVFAELEEPHVWATLTRRDSVIFHDNDFELFIDPDGDGHRYSELEINALGTVWDLFLDIPYRDGGCAVWAYDITGSKSAIHVDGTLGDPSDIDRGWSVELALPWSILRECAPGGRPPRAGERWRVNFSRVQWTTDVRDGEYVKRVDRESGENLPEDNWVWSPQGRIDMHAPECWGIVQFSDRVAGDVPEVCRPLPDERAGWALWQVYHLQHEYHDLHGRYTSCPRELGLPALELPDHEWPPILEASHRQFDAILPRRDGRGALEIRQDGRLRAVARDAKERP